MISKSIKRQLKEYYRRIGVGIRRAEKMVKTDCNRVCKYQHWPASHLGGAFVWNDTPEGHNYWSVRDAFESECG